MAEMTIEVDIRTCYVMSSTVEPRVSEPPSYEQREILLKRQKLGFFFSVICIYTDLFDPN